MIGLFFPLVDKETLNGSIVSLVFFCSTAVLATSGLASSFAPVFSWNLLLVGYALALAGVAIAIAMMSSVLQKLFQLAWLFYLVAIFVSATVLFQWPLGLPFFGSPQRLSLNALPAVDAWREHVSYVLASIMALLSLSALLLRRKTLAATMVAAIGTGLSAALALGIFTAYLAGVTVLPAGLNDFGAFNLLMSFLLALMGLSHGLQILTSAAFTGWRSTHPWQNVFTEAKILLSLLCVLVFSSAGVFAMQNQIYMALVALLLFFMLVFFVIFRPIEALVKSCVAATEELLVRKTSLAQAQALLGRWSMRVPGGELQCSREWFRIFGLSPEFALTIETFLAEVHPEDRKYVIKSWDLALTKADYDIQNRILVNGSVKWVREREHQDAGY